jgi:three-Cys-motif partner protein
LHPQRAVDSPQTDPCPQLPIELGPKEDGVGDWVPKEKHKYLCDWLIGTRYAWKGWQHRVLIDPFCGPGRIQVKDEAITREGGSVVAWRQSVLNQAPFTHVLVGDISETRATANSQRLAAIEAPVEHFVGAASDTVPEMIKRVPQRRCLTLAYIDPYNLEFLSFDIIQALAQLPAVDFLVHFSVYDLQRNIELEADEDRGRFDSAAPGWRNAIDPNKFGKVGLREAFFKYWSEQIKNLGFGISKSMPLVRAEGNSPRYRLVFFSRNAKIASKVWTDVAQGSNRTLDFGD